MTTADMTGWVLIGAVVVLVGWELYTLRNNESDDEISAVIRRAAFRRPILPFAAGVLMGHWFW